jgi:hypothetical protein
MPPWEGPIVWNWGALETWKQGTTLHHRVLEHLATVLVWKTAMRSSHGRGRICQGPSEKFKQQGAWAVRVVVVSGHTLLGKEQVPSTEDHYRNNSIETIARDVLGLQELSPSYVCLLSVMWLGLIVLNLDPMTHAIFPSSFLPQAGELLGGVWKQWDQPLDYASWLWEFAAARQNLWAQFLWITWFPYPPSSHKVVNCWMGS